MRPLPRLVVTLGDPAGIGPEVILRALARPAVRRLARFLLLGDARVLEATRDRLGLRAAWAVRAEGAPLFDGPPGLLECGPRLPLPRPGRWTRATGAASLAWVEKGIELCRSSAADGMVTGPICKAAWKAAGARWPGHTELLAERTGVEDEVMMLAGGGLRVALATTHLPLCEVPRRITKAGLLRTGRTLALGLRKMGVRRPRIGVLGLNPHAGEEGCLGREESAVIAPAIAALRRAGIDATGPLAADTAFHHALRGGFDAILAMYHDQGLAPLKTLAFETGVNVTLGLPIVRVSPDHGTAFDIAGRGRADPASMIEALRLAARLARR